MPEPRGFLIFDERMGVLVGEIARLEARFEIVQVCGAGDRVVERFFRSVGIGVEGIAFVFF